MEYFYYSLGAIALLYVSGLGLTILLLPESLRRYTLIFAPWIGFCYINLACWPVFLCGGQIGPKTARILLLPPIVCLVIELVRRRQQKLWPVILSFPTLAALAMTGVTFTVLSIPAFWKTNGLTTVSLGNNDIATYGMVSRYLSEFPRHSTEGFVGQLAAGPNPLQYVAKDFYFGTSALVSFAGRLLGLMPHQQLSLFVFLFSALGATAVFILFHERFGLRTTGALCGVAFVAFHPMLQFIAGEGFFAQVVATGLALLIFWGNAKLLDSNNMGWDRARLCLLVTVLTCGLVLNYAHMLIFVWFFVGVYTITLSFLERSLHGIKICVGANILVALSTALILPQRVKPLWDVFTIYGSADLGWFIPWMSPDYLVGLMYKNPLLEIEADWRWRLVISIFLAVVFFISTYIAYRKGHRRIVAVGFAGLAVYAGCFVLAVMGRKDGTLGGYKSFKLVSFFVPFYALALISAWSVVKSRYRRIDLISKSFVAMAVIGGFVMAERSMLKPARYVKVESQFESLLGLERTSSVKSINVRVGEFWPTMWVAYFLIHKKLYLENPSYYIRSEPLGDYDLEDKADSPSEIIHVKSDQMLAIRNINDRFRLVGPLNGKLRVRLGLGWHPGEVGHVWSGKDARRSSLILHSPEDGVRVRLKLICSPLQANDRLTLQARGEKLNAAVDRAPDGQEEIRVSNLVLNKGDNEVDIISDLDPIPPNTADTRPLSYSFSSVEVDKL